jgi:sucrose-6-phosphate hydrolase SacC (GH32 family)
MKDQLAKTFLVVVATAVLLAAPFAVRTAAADKPAEPRPPELRPEPPLADKTLVAWVVPQNLTQRGGSALTIEDGSDHFDGIVFGELAPAKWMAGSDTFSRTQKDQSKCPAETADRTTSVQMAIVYQGKRVTVYRNGLRYSQHTMADSPQEFGPQSTVVIGKRHRRQADNAHFAGSIDDARIYDRALSAEQIAALAPNVNGDVEPWAWWTFDDEEAKERTGRFLITQLTNGAKVVAGKLVLDGKTGTLLGKSGKEIPFSYETPARPENPPANWLTYHLAHPGPGNAMPGDPNCAFFWNGRYHLHYIYTHQDGFSFAHVSSTDMLRWQWHPTTLTPPKTEHGMFSGTGFFTKEGKPAIIYHGQGSGRNQIAIAEDDQLEKWSAPMALEPKIRSDQDGSKIAHWDPDAWWDGNSYFALSGGSPGSGKPPTLFKSQDLRSWDYLGLFLSKDMPDVQADEDISCPNFFKIGNKQMLLCISHNKGCRYYLGEWKDEKFTPEFHARMNWKGWDFFAPESLFTPDGRRVMWAWCNLGSPQSGIQSLPRELSLLDDGVLRIKPLRELKSLRYDERSEAHLTVKSDVPYRLKEIAGDTLELKVSLKPGSATQFGIEVYCDQQGRNGFPIVVELASKTLRLGDTEAPFDLHAGEDLELRVFIDKNMIEVFANERQAVVASHKYAPEDVGIRVFSNGGDVTINDVRAWKMKSIYAGER